MYRGAREWRTYSRGSLPRCVQMYPFVPVCMCVCVKYRPLLMYGGAREWRTYSKGTHTLSC